jgi:hypothetical protein
MTQAPQTTQEHAPDLRHRLEILDLVNAFGLYADARRWDDLQQLLADPVRVDYTSLNGGEPVTTSPTELVRGWRRVLGGLQATQHLIANHQIALDGHRATCTAYVQATHVLPNASGGPVWTVAGRYDFALHRSSGAWRIAGLTLTVQWATGNQQIMQLAASQATPS